MTRIGYWDAMGWDNKKGAENGYEGLGKVPAGLAQPDRNYGETLADYFEKRKLHLKAQLPVGASSLRWRRSPTKY